MTKNNVSVFGNKIVTLGTPKDDKSVWSTQKIDQYLYNLEHGLMQDRSSPFFDRKMGIRKGNLNFHLTKWEEEEIYRCMNDVIYFADKYCYAMTDNGVEKITLRDYQKKVLKEFQNNRFNIFLSSRQSGKTITSSFFLAWYICFNIDRNALIVSNRSFTMMEIMDKIKVVYRELPFFLKPGVFEYNKSTMTFDNGCKLIGETTSESPALGFTIHLLYADEFAHIPKNIVESFYQNIYPTLSSSQISKMIITSTPNGLNKFYDIWTGACKGENEFIPTRVDWWDVPGRDEVWKEREVGNLGSIEAFNQQYGNQFLTSDRLLLDLTTTLKLDRIKNEYIVAENLDLNVSGIEYKKIKWHHTFDIDNIDKSRYKYILSVDISDGVSKDYSVINIFRLEPLSIVKIRKLKNYKDEGDFFKLRQVGIYKSNTISIDDLSNVLLDIIFNIFNSDCVKLIIEINFKGELLIEKLYKHNDFYSEIILHTKHSQGAKNTSPGIKLNRSNKPMMCNEFSYLLRDGKIIIDEKETVEESLSFGLDKNDNYSSQLGHDDAVMTCINLVPYLQSTDYYYDIEDIIDKHSNTIRNLIDKKMQNTTMDDKEAIDYSFLKSLNN